MLWLWLLLVSCHLPAMRQAREMGGAVGVLLVVAEVPQLQQQEEEGTSRVRVM
jgi:hypothetical protein